MSLLHDYIDKHGEDTAKQITNVEFVLNALDKYLPVGGNNNNSGGGGVKPVTVVIGTSTAGHSAGEVDILCDGINDADLINAAIAALPATGGKIVIREGTYNLNGSISVDKDNVTLQGMGNSTVLNAVANIKLVWPDPSGLIHITGSYCKIAELKITNNPSTVVDCGIYIGSGNNIITDNICSNGSEGNRSYGIYIDSDNNTITGNICSNSGGNSNGIGGGGSNNTITGNICSNSSGFYTGPDEIYSDSRGIYIYGGSNNIITDNICSNTTIDDISYGYSNGIYIGSSNSTITGNTCCGNGGIWIGSSSNTITGNTCCGNGGISIGGGGGSNTITGNTCCGNGNGIHIESSRGNTITGNACSNNGMYGIYIGSSNNIITDNICSNDSGGGGGGLSYGIYICGDNNTITSNICSNRGWDNNNYNGLSYGICIGGSGNSITGNTCSNFYYSGGSEDSGSSSYGIWIGSSNSTITGNICSNSNCSATGDGYCYGIYIYDNSIHGNIISHNIIGNRREGNQSISNTFALYIPETSHYCTIHGNNLRGVTDNNGSAYHNGTEAATLPGSATTIAALNTDGSCGFNIM